MGLWFKIGLFLFLGVVVLILNLVARRRNFDRFRRVHSRRKYRVVRAPDETPGGEDDASM